MQKSKYLKLVVGALMMISLSCSALANSVSLNYSATQKNGTGQVSKGAWELSGAKAISDTTDLTAKGILANNHKTDGYGVGLELGARFKAPIGDSVTAWLQPAVALRSPESGGGYIGYVVDAGLDLKHSHFTFTPAVSYANDFGDSRTVRQTTAGLKAAYALTKNWSADVRARHEFNESGYDANRLYGGVSYKL